MSNFEKEKEQRVIGYSKDIEFKKKSLDWVRESMERKYVYNFNWLGRPIIQYPQDIVAMQELIFTVKPDLIIETGIAHGGSLIFSASMLALLDLFDAKGSESTTLNSMPRKVLGIDIDIRDINKREILNHPLASKIEMIEGSSIDDNVINHVREFARDYNKVLVCLDSNHTYEHVLRELNAYSSLVSVGSYIIVFDTFVEDMPAKFFSDRPWDVGNNPKTAVHEFLLKNNGYEIDYSIQNKLLITVAPDGYVKRIKS